MHPILNVHIIPSRVWASNTKHPLENMRICPSLGSITDHFKILVIWRSVHKILALKLVTVYPINEKPWVLCILGCLATIAASPD